MNTTNILPASLSSILSSCPGIARPHEHQSRMLVGCAIAFLIAWFPGSQTANAQVRFDAITLVDCHDITPVEFAEIHPDEKLVEAVFDISAFSSREQYDGMDFVIQIVSPNRTMRVVDWLPNTAVTSEYASNLAHEEGSERTATIGLNATGSIADMVSLSGNTGLNNKKTTKLRYEKLPPTQILSAAGTLNRGAGVYFKLKPSSQTTLEGNRDYVVTFRVPHSWRGDVVQLSCRARRFNKGGLFSDDTIETVANESFLVAMYLDVDSQAKHAANQLVDAELALRSKAARHGNLTTSSKSGFSFVSTAEPVFPSNWLSEIVFDPQPRTVPQYVKQMPKELRESVLRLARAKLNVQRLAY